LQTIKRSHDLDPKGNISVVFHSAEGIPGTEWKTLDKDRKAKRLIAVDRETGKLAPLEEEKLYYPDMKEYKKGITKQDLIKFDEGKIKSNQIYDVVPVEKGRLRTSEWRLDNLNHTQWDNSISQLIFNKERADEILEQNQIQISHLLEDQKKGRLNPERLSPTQQQALSHYNLAETYLDDTRQQAEALFHKAYKYGNEKQKEKLIMLSKKFQKDLENNGLNPTIQSKAISNLMMGLKAPEMDLAPQMYMPIEKFATEQSSKTFGNAAFDGWKKFKESAPIINIENPPVGFALSTGEDLRNLIKASRNQFVNKAVEEGISKSEAKKQAEKLIGATWDVGHINMLRKQGFEEKDIIKETEKIAPYVNHVHLSDNFGLEHTELPMGMGNVPIKEIMEKLGKKGFEAKKIIEAGNWWQHFQTSPVQETMELMGSQIYADGVGPYWNQAVGLQQGYLGGYGMMLPQVNYQTFGAGFSQLPSELGGQMPGAQGSRMSGKPME